VTLRVVTPAVGPAVPLAELRAHLRIDDAGEDAVLAAYEKAAVELVERMTQRRIGAQTLEWVLPAWRGVFRFPVAPVGAVEWIRYVDALGVVQTVDADAYFVIPSGETSAVCLRCGHHWPCLGEAAEPVTIRFAAGGPPSASLAHAIKLLVGHWYDRREATAAAGGSGITDLPFGVEALVAGERWD